MNEILKQRLVGALILVALGVVFWPIIFVEPGERAGQERGRIPERPNVDVTALEPPDMAGLRPSPEIQLSEKVEVGRDAALPEADAAKTTAAVSPESKQSAAAATVDQPGGGSGRARTEPPEKPTLDSDGVPVAWMLQVASVSSADKAEALRQRLLEMNHKAYVKRIKNNGKTLFRVYIGPGFERARFDRMKADIDREFSVQSLVVRYLP